MRLPLLLLCTAAFAQHKQYPDLKAVSWMQTSAEYIAVTTGAYQSAARSLDAALADPNWSAAYEQGTDLAGKPPAIILDLDETVLDNSPFQAKAVAEDSPFSEDAFQAWVKEARAGAISGAVRFLDNALLKGVAPFYITNRVCDPMSPSDATVRVLKQHRIPFDPSRLLCKTSSSDKTERRRSVAAKHRVLLLIGDDFNDFVAPPTSVAERADLARFHSDKWGVKWFLIPNPTYGSWERAVGSTIAEKLKALRQ
jgi:acid phosphatase